MAPRKPGNLNPEGSGRGSMPALGRSSQNTAAANKRAGAGAAAKRALANTRLATNRNISVEKVFPSGAYRVTDLKTFKSEQFMGYTKAQAIKLFKQAK